jgi:hypothetical protein
MVCLLHFGQAILRRSLEQTQILWRRSDKACSFVRERADGLSSAPIPFCQGRCNLLDKA